MNRLFYMTILLLGSLALLSQPRSIKDIDELVHRIQQERDHYEEVNVVNTLTLQKQFYYKEDILQIVALRYPEKIEKIQNLYFSQNHLVFTETQWLDTLKGRLLYTEKTYHAQDAMFAWLNTENTFVDSDTPEFKSQDADLRRYALKLKQEALR